MDGAPDLMDPSIYWDGVPYDALTWLRENDPVHWHAEPNGGPGFWALTRYADIKAVEADSETFSSEPSSVIVDTVSMATGAAKHLITSDPPHHTAHRKVLGVELQPIPVRSMSDSLQSVVDEVVDEVIERGECDVIDDLGRRLASYVTADILGLSRLEAFELCDAAEVLTRGGSKQEGPGLAATQTMFKHAGTAWQERQAKPGGTDMLSRLAQAEILGAPVDQIQFSMDFLLLVTAGSDTTRNVVGAGMGAFFEHPEQQRLLVENEELLPGAVEEILRWATPITYQRRTATRDTEIGGKAIAEGQKVVNWYVAANRDPEVFSDPDTFDITRSPNPHVAFGGGRHFCLGSHLARLELTLMFAAIMKRMPDMRPTGPWEYRKSPITPSVLGPAVMPVAFTPGERVAA